MGFGFILYIGTPNFLFLGDMGFTHSHMELKKWTEIVELKNMVYNLSTFFLAI